MDSRTAFRLTNNDSNYFFGFHDLVAWNNAGDKLAALKVDDIYSPPYPSQPCDVGFVKDTVFTKLGTTIAYNYPQGARQQWIGKTNLLIVNDQVGDKWGSKIYDTDQLIQTATLNFPTHVITDDGWAFGIDYARLHRVGGYGYTGLKDKSSKNNAPADNGIFKHNVYTKENTLLVSIETVANFQANVNAGKHHYITHLLLNPAQNRVAFLHRCKLSDGGETTRLMTIGIEGNDLRVLASGFLSHFDWKDDTHLVIWGRTGTGIEALRNSLLFRMMPTGVMSLAKKVVKSLLNKNRGAGQAGPKDPSFNWLIFSDEDKPHQSFLAKEVITEDGHPMFCPTNRDWMICDTYPNENDLRTLFLFQYSKQKRIDLGTYKMIKDKPDIKEVGHTLEDVDNTVLKSFSVENMAFFRSGLHCDLHPRWNRDGTLVGFDSIHEGIRQIYAFDVKQYIK